MRSKLLESARLLIGSAQIRLGAPRESGFHPKFALRHIAIVKNAFLGEKKKKKKKDATHKAPRHDADSPSPPVLRKPHCVQHPLLAGFRQRRVSFISPLAHHDLVFGDLHPSAGFKMHPVREQPYDAPLRRQVLLTLHEQPRAAQKLHGALE